MFSCILAFLGPKIDKLAIYFVYMRGTKIQKLNVNFSILGPKMHICYTYINLWTTMKLGFHHAEIKKKLQLNFYKV